MPKKKTKPSQEVSVKPVETVSPQKQNTAIIWTEEQVQLIKNTVAKDATDDELKLFLYTASRTGLDPLARQIHFVKRGGRMTIQTGIDGYRAIAERTGTLAGIDDAIYTYSGQNKIIPEIATVTVYRVVKGLRVGFTASARWTEYAPQGSQGFMWDKMPHLMLGKVAESLALRKAFPLNLSGIYTDDEMLQADKTPIDVVVQPEPVLEQPIFRVSDKTRIAYLVKKLDIVDPIPENVKAITGLELVEENYPEIVNRLEIIYKENKENQ